MELSDKLVVIGVIGIAVLIVLLYNGLKTIGSQKESPYRSTYKSNEFTKQRTIKGKRQVYHKEDNVWLDGHTISLLLIDSASESGYTSLDSLEEIEPFVGEDYSVTGTDYERYTPSSENIAPTYSGGSDYSSSSSSYSSSSDSSSYSSSSSSYSSSSSSYDSSSSSSSSSFD